MSYPELRLHSPDLSKGLVLAHDGSLKLYRVGDDSTVELEIDLDREDLLVLSAFAEAAAMAMMGDA